MLPGFAQMMMAGTDQFSPPFNPADKDAGVTLSDNDYSMTATGATQAVRAVVGLASGQWFFEATNRAASSTDGLGIANASDPLNGYRMAQGPDSYGYEATGAVGGGTSGITTYATYTTGDVIGVAVDLTAGKLWVSKNNVWQNGDPVAGTSGLTLATSVTYYPVAVAGSAALCWTMAKPILYGPPVGFSAWPR